MFQFCTFAPQPLYIQGWVSHKGMGCPIRTSTDLGLFTSSLWLFADYRVLLRLSTPRHPPCALTAWSHQPDAAAFPSGSPPRFRLGLHGMTSSPRGWPC